MFRTIFLHRKISTLVTLLVWILFTLTACGSDPQATARKKLAKQNEQMESMFSHLDSYAKDNFLEEYPKHKIASKYFSHKFLHP